MTDIQTQTQTGGSLPATTGAALETDGSSRPWRHIVARYAVPDTRRGVTQLLTTGLPFLAIMGVLLYLIDRGVWAALPLIVPLAALLVRLFAIQHDCGHGSFFRSRRANDWLGRTLGVLTFTPYAYWRRKHAVHHATSGNLDRRGIGDIHTLTVREYLARSRWMRFAYRLYRHPVVMLGVGPAYLFLIRHRLPTGSPFRHWRGWASVLGTNAALAAAAASMALTIGLQPLLLGYLPVLLLAASIGVWMFYVQHQFAGTYWEDGSQWTFERAAFDGCSYYDLPRILHWATGSLGIHHLHHLSSRIPNYRLRECFEQNPVFRDAAKRLRLWESLKGFRLALWDEEARQLVPFRRLRDGGRGCGKEWAVGRRALVYIIGLATSLSLLLAPLPVQAVQTPSSFVSAFLDEAFGLFRSGDTSADARRAALRSLFETKMDLALMARTMTGDRVIEATPNVQAHFLNLLSGYLVDAYSLKIEESAASTFDVAAGAPSPQGATPVITTIRKPGSPPEPITWSVLPSNDGSYKIVDVQNQGISLVVTQRAVFGAVMRNGGGLETLIAALEAQSRRLSGPP